jgi:hypothetical protein
MTFFKHFYQRHLEEKSLKSFRNEIKKKKLDKAKLYREIYKDGEAEIREYPPVKRTIFFFNGPRYTVQLPYQIFIFSGSTFLGFASKPVKNISDNIYFPPLPNIKSDYKICFGDTYAPDRSRVDRFWNSYCNNDCTKGPDHAIAYFGGYSEWQKLTLEQVSAKLKYPCSLKRLLQLMSRDGEFPIRVFKKIEALDEL